MQTHLAASSYQHHSAEMIPGARTYLVDERDELLIHVGQVGSSLSLDDL